MVPVDQVCDADPACFPTIQDAIDLGSAPVVEVLGGVHAGDLQVTRDLTIRGVYAPVLAGGASLPAVVTVAPGVSVTFEDLVIEAFGLSRGIVADGAGRLALEGVLLAGGTGAGGSCLAAAGAAEVRLADTLVTGCLGTEGAVRVVDGDVTVERVGLVGNDTPVLVSEGAGSVTLTDTVVDSNGWTAANGPAVHLADADRVDVLRTWLCLNFTGARGALEVEAGCGAGCTVEHGVFQLNGGRGIEWTGAQGLVRHATFAANVGAEDGAQVRVSGGVLALEDSVVVDLGAIGGRTALARAGDATVTVADVAIAANEPGVPLGVDGVVPFVPHFVEGYVPPVCGEPVVHDPRYEDDAGVLVWPGDDGKGALTTDACGPWCADADGDGSPAMWDCDEGDPALRHSAEEVPLDGVDQDCDGLDGCWLDADADGYGGSVVPLVPSVGCAPPYFATVGGDCDDGDWTVSPAADEAPADGTDADCDGAELCWADGDADGFTGALGESLDLWCGPPYALADGGDCDDADATIHPGADEVALDGIDQDCRGGDVRGAFTGGACGCAGARADASLGLLLAVLLRRSGPRKG